MGHFDRFWAILTDFGGFWGLFRGSEAKIRPVGHNGAILSADKFFSGFGGLTTENMDLHGPCKRVFGLFLAILGVFYRFWQNGSKYEDFWGFPGVQKPKYVWLVIIRRFSRFTSFFGVWGSNDRKHEFARAL